ncbi:Uma2 family endonuclease [Amycolatopsis pithecellobii]|uniref:Uma2 family endonuclease n=1 Tax=Amycolatopsis pithecellobii TaxID=664692 RepID=A0A6N7YW85_9PSEU|nr:Uma2 family endonuclease [Amycolatopsis pithecellobii]MTD57347.1 Uma2 family endonuclease [Amycolatopsis pithecellobii]
MTALSHDWFIPPPGGWTLADVRSLPEDSRVEVLDGALIVNPRPLPLHQRITRRLAAVLEPQLPGGWQLETDVDVLLAEEPLDYVAPDLVVFAAELPLTTRPIPGDQVLLVVEVVSRGSRREDRGAKPLAYAEAGIRHFWRVESPVSGALALSVHTHVLADGAYRATGEHTGLLRTTVEYPLEIDLAGLTH